MADIAKIQKIAEKLGLRHMASGAFELDNETLSNLDYLEQVLSMELELKTQARTIRLRQKSKLPLRVFDSHGLPNALKWQIEQLNNLSWLDSHENVIILGKCNRGKTSLAVELGEKAIKEGYKVYYVTMETLLMILRQREQYPKADYTFKYIMTCDLIIIDDVFYSEFTREEAHMFYRAVALLNESRSLMVISNREVSAWLDAAEDKHLMQTLQDRLTQGCQIVRP